MMKDILSSLASVVASVIVEESKNYDFGIVEVEQIWEKELIKAIREELADVQERAEKNKNTE